MENENKNKDEKRNKTQDCEYIAYSVTPENQPIIVNGAYFCKHCLREVEIDLCLGIKPGWFHKSNGKIIKVFDNGSDKE